MIDQILSKIVKEVNEKIPRVNSGGCAVFAYKLAQKLLEHGYDDFKFYIKHYSEDYGVFNCSHIWICYNGMEYNHNGCTATEYRSKDFIPTLEKSVKRNIGQWNWSYNRYYNPHITKIVNKHFAVLK